MIQVNYSGLGNNNRILFQMKEIIVNKGLPNPASSFTIRPFGRITRTKKFS